MKREGSGGEVGEKGGGIVWICGDRGEGRDAYFLFGVDDLFYERVFWILWRLCEENEYYNKIKQILLNGRK